MTNSNDRLSRIEALVESNARAIQALSNSMATNNEATNAAIAVTNQKIEGLVQIVTEFSIKSEARLNKIDDAITGINAAITGINVTNQNLERILEELVRRDRNGNGDQPQF